MPLVGFIQGKMDLRWIIAFGLVIGFIGLRMLGDFSLDVDFYHVVMARIVQASGIAFLFVPISTLSYSNLPPEENTAASGFINLARNIGGSMGIAVSTTFLARWTQEHQTYLSAHVTHYDPAFRHQLAALALHFVNQGRVEADAMRQALMAIYQEVINQATMLGYLDVFRMMGWFFLLAVPLCFMMKKPSHIQAGAA